MAQQRSDLGLPAWMMFLRVAQGALALLILILSAVAAWKYLGGADPSFLVASFPGFGFCWFAFAWTAVYLPLAIFMIPRLSSNAKPGLLLFVLDALSTLWWLVTFALLADHAVKIGLAIDLTYSYGSTYYNDFTVALNLTRACGALGAVEFVMFAVGTVFVGMAAFRKNNGNSQGASFAMSNGTTISVQEYPKDAQQQVPYPTGGSELSATRYP